MTSTTCKTTGGHASGPSLVEAACARARARPNRQAYFFLKDRLSVDASLTCGQLHRDACAIAGFLQSRLDVGARVLLLYPPGLDFVRAFWGCLYAGVLAVPALPPDMLRIRTSLPRLQAIADDADVACVLTTPQVIANTDLAHLGWRQKDSLPWISLDEIGENWCGKWTQPNGSLDHVAYLQYTSGSTSAPKGVMVTHGNVVHQVECITRFGCYGPDSIVLSWMPHFHDYGLVQGILHPLLTDIPAYLMPAVAFLKRPIRWLQAIARYGVTHSGGPNFAYAHCVRSTTPDERSTLNLGSWRVASCGAEPISAETIAAFSAAFAAVGFDPRAFFPAYGMAEYTLLISLKPAGAPPGIRYLDAQALQEGTVRLRSSKDTRAHPVVSCGRPVGDTQVAIVDPLTLRECPPDATGEIWLAGKSVAKGYWRKPEDTSETFGARVAGSGAGPYLRTGDLGFMQDGEVFVTGRLKDLIIIRGRNHYPQDIEGTVEKSHPAFRSGCGAAFSIERNGEEQLVVVQEMERRERSSDIEELAGVVRRAVSEHHDLQVHAVVLVRAGSIPKTTSGKIQRRACKAAFLAQQLAIVGTSILSAEKDDRSNEDVRCEDVLALADGEREPVVIAYLARLIAKRVRVPADRLDSEQPLTAFGLDSLTGAELAHEIERRFGISLPMASLLDGATIRHVARWLLESIGGTAPSAQCSRREQPDGREYPLSRNQAALWFLHQLAPESSAANASLLLRMTGSVNAANLRQALQTVSDRHTSLRTTFSSNDGIPFQRVLPSLRVHLEETDASSWSCEDLREGCTKATEVPFDLTRGPLWRVCLFWRSTHDVILLLVAHHIVVDGWSLMVLVDDIRRSYRAAVDGDGPAAAPPEAEYSDFVQWQGQFLRSLEGQRQLDYWREKLSGRLPMLDLPRDRPRPVVQGDNGASEPVTLDETLTRRLRALAKAEGATLYATLMAALQVLLYRCTGQDDILVGSPMLGRSQAKFAEIVGDFVNVVVVRESLTGETPFVDHLARTRKTVLGALAHQDYPFSSLVENLQPGRDLSRAPLVQVLFVLQQFKALTTFAEAEFAVTDMVPSVSEGTRFESLLLPQKTGQFDITLEIADVGERLTGFFEYNADLFEAATVKRLRDHFVTLLESIVERPDQRVADLPILTPDERRQVVVTWNDTGTARRDARCLHELVQEQARRTPHAHAVVFENGALTYQELCRRANQIGHYLQKLGVGPDVLVGLYVERSSDLILGLLGILQAGGAYVPLDPDTPQRRVAAILDDAGAPIVLTQQHLLSQLPSGATRAICLDTQWHLIAQEPPEPPATGATPANLAYVIWTSGTSGRPKGVMVEHQAAVNYTKVASGEFGLSPADRVLQLASIGFDTAVEEIFPCLATGAALVLRTRSMLDSVPGFLSKCRDWGVTVVDLPTSYWHELTGQLAAEGLQWPPTVRTVVIGGERAIRQSLVAWHEHVGSRVRLVNTYGPTEATVVATVCDLSSADSFGESWQTVPIGRPIQNVQVYVLDRNTQPVPVGVPGELCVGGAGLARGYLNRPDLTAASFFAHPFSAEPGARLYRTGDRARWRPDGRLEFLGRTDRQVKINGYRIELEEIEKALEANPDVRQAVVEVREDLPGDKRLVAFVAAAPGSTLTVATLRDFLQEQLPHYMIPSAFVELDVVPLTSNGKIDHEALQVPLDSRARIPRLRGPYVEPRTPTEFLLAQIWGEILEIKDVGIHDNFFELGGHSLLATQLFSRVRSLFGAEPPLRTVFENPTIAGLAQWLDATSFRTSDRDYAQVIPTAPRGEPLPLSYAQERMWFLHALTPESAAYTIPASVRLTGPLDKDALAFSINGIVRRHESLRTTFREVEGQPAQLINPFRPVPIREVDLESHPKARREDEALHLVSEETRRPFDLTTGPLFRVLLIHLSEEDHILSVITHHIVADQWSYGIIGRELVQGYNGFCAGHRSAADAPPTIQYADFAVWQRDWLRGKALQDQLAYWKTKLADLPVLTLPTDRPRPAAPSFRGTYISRDLPRTLVNRLRQLSIQEGATLYMIFLASFVTLLHRLTGQHDIPVGTPIANRNWLATEGVIGTFVNTLVLRGDVSGDPTFRTLLSRVREVALGAYAHQDVPFEKLVEELSPDRSHGGQPLVQVLFNFANTPFGRVDFKRLSWAPLEIDRGAAQFDLSLSVEPALRRRVYLEFNTDLFDRASMERWLTHYATLLEAIADGPDTPVSQLRLLSEADRRRILTEWNDTRTPSPDDRGFPQMFEEQVAKTPDALAVESSEARLTYADLNRRANQVAHHLMRRGVQPDDVVGIYVERSVDLLVCLLGILKSGAAYLPLTPGLPVKRIESMLHNSGAALVVTQDALAQNVPTSDVRVLSLEREQHLIARESSANPSLRPLPQHLAYVIYTSGSTGQPKGVEVEHRSLSNFLRSMQQTPGLTDQDVVLAVTTVSFDIAALELYLPLMVGASVLIASHEQAADGSWLREQLDGPRVTVMQATPATWQMVVQAGWTGRTRVRCLCGGEALSRELARDLRVRAGSVWNMYGPTETTIWSTIERVTQGDGAVAIGRPIANTRVYVLDSRLEPVPIGIPGDLYIGGAGVARGYRHAPELTAAKFVVNPLTNERVYRTGDLARWLPDGRLDCLGRIDHQVKIRGFRIELGEIESALGEAPEVKQCVVVAREGRNGDKRLIAYVVPEKAGTLPVRQLRLRLRDRLPDYMIPAAIIPMESWPLTATGKIDRRALPSPGDTAAATADEDLQPRNRVELQLAAIWEQLLGITGVGIRANFFDLGGHSLLALRMMGAIEQTLGTRLPISLLFRAPTIERLAAALDQEGCAVRWKSLVAIQPDGTQPPFFAIPGVGGNVLMFARLSQMLGTDQPFYAFQALGLDGNESPLTSVPEMAALYIQEARTVQPTGPYVIGGTCTGGVVAYEMAQQLSAQGENVTLAIMETWHPRSHRIHRSRLQYRLWPAQFLLLKMIGSCRTALTVSYREWPKYWLEKISKATALLRRGVLPEDRQELASGRVQAATFLAVSRYEPQPYRGRLLNVIASERSCGDSTEDTRLAWSGLACKGAETVSVPAENAGLLFASPHVQQLAKHLGAFISRECIASGDEPTHVSHTHAGDGGQEERREFSPADGHHAL
jgi:amino acid adenylation domain-containing protein